MLDKKRAKELRELVHRFTVMEGGRSIVVRSLKGPHQIDEAMEAEIIRPAAAMIKLPLAVGVWEEAQAKLVDWDALIELDDLPASVFPSLRTAFSRGSRLRLRELVGLSLITGDNPIADYLVGRIGAEAVDRAALRMGAEDTYLRCGFADPYLSSAGRLNQTTAKDVAKMMTKINDDRHLGEIRLALRNNIRRQWIPLHIPAETPVLHVGGTLPGVVTDAAILKGGSLELLIIVIADHQRSPISTGLAVAELTRRIWNLLDEQTV